MPKVSVVSTATIQDYLGADLVRYSLYAPPGYGVCTIYETMPDGAATYIVIIENDQVFVACGQYLQAAKVPAFTTVNMLDAYLQEFEQQLRRGCVPAQAREQALCFIGFK